MNANEMSFSSIQSSEAKFTGQGRDRILATFKTLFLAPSRQRGGAICKWGCISLQLKTRTLYYSLVAVWINDSFMRIKKKIGRPTMQIESTHQALDIQGKHEEEIKETRVI